MLLAALLVFAPFAQRTRAEGEASWKATGKEQSIALSTREEPGSALPSFRGETTLRGALLHVLAVVLDDVRSPEWASVDAASVLRKIDARTHIVYSLTEMTWPVRDRDLVMKRTVQTVRPELEYLVSLRCIPGERPVVQDTIRIARCSSSFRLRKVDATHTSVDYRVHAEPGGSNPDWIVRMASKDIPVETLTGLQRQLDKTKRDYADVMRAWAAAR
jgi:hypothetical protein